MFAEEKLLMETERVWNVQGIRGAIVKLFEDDTVPSELVSYVDVIDAILKKQGIVNYDSKLLNEKIKKIVMHKVNIDNLLYQIEEPDGEYKKICDSWQNEMKKGIEDLINTLENLFNNLDKSEKEETVDGVVKKLMNLNDTESLETALTHLFNNYDTSSVHIIFDKYMSQLFEKYNKVYLNDEYKFDSEINLIITDINEIKEMLKMARAHKGELSSIEKMRLESLMSRKDNSIKGLAKVISIHIDKSKEAGIGKENTNNLSVEEFVEFLFDRENNLVSSEKIVDQLDKYLRDNKLSLLMNSEITNDLIYDIISLKDRIAMNVLTMGIEKQLNDKLEIYINTIKEELNSAVSRKQLFDKEEKLENDVLKIYSEEGLRPALKYLFSEGLDVSIYEIFDNVLYKIYLKNNVKYEKSPHFSRVIEDVMHHVKNSKFVMESSSGEVSKENKEKLMTEERLFNNCITLLVDEIIKDFNVNRININLPLDDFVTRLFEVGYQDRTVNGIYNQICNYFEHRNIQLDEKNDIKTLIKAILDYEESYYIHSPLQEFKNKEEKDTSVVKGKIDGLINILRTYTGLQEQKYLSSVLDEKAARIKQYYDKMEKITKENNDMYFEIEQLRRRIELNEDKKRGLTQEFRREEGIPKK